MTSYLLSVTHYKGLKDIRVKDLLLWPDLKRGKAQDNMSAGDEMDCEYYSVCRLAPRSMTALSWCAVACCIFPSCHVGAATHDR